MSTSPANTFESRAPATPSAAQSAMASAVSSRAAQEVQAAMVIAKKFPRDEEAARTAIARACCRPKLAAVAEYEYPRGGEKVSGPSIRLAEVLAQCWGNIDSGVVELGQADGESQVMAYCWDLQTNTRDTKVFTVPHIRYTKNGPKKLGDDPRDVYELVANQGARRKRACILAVIPGDIVDEALVACNRTLDKSDSDKPFPDRLKAMVESFTEYKVTLAMLEAKLGHKIEATTDRELLRLGRIFNSIRDGIGKMEAFFEVPAAVTASPFAGATTGDVTPKAETVESLPKEGEKASSEKEVPPAADGEAELFPKDNREAKVPGPNMRELIALIGGDGISPDTFLEWAIGSKHLPKGSTDTLALSEETAGKIVGSWPSIGALLIKRERAAAERAGQAAGGKAKS